MSEVSESKRDPRTPADLEEIFPGRMWVIARKAAEHGWDVAVRPTAKGWALFLTEDHHCIHLFWQPNSKPNQERHPWDLHKSSLATRCPSGGRVHIKHLPDYLANHPDECADTHTRVPLHEMSNRQSCEDHLCPAGAAAARRDPANIGWTPGEPFNDGNGIVPGYVAGKCGHRVAQSEWEAGFETCERC